MKRFLLFYGDTYYPLGGWDDFRGSFATMEEAEDRASTNVWYQVVDPETWQVVDGVLTRPWASGGQERT